MRRLPEARREFRPGIATPMISVALCTFDRPESLARALQSLCALASPPCEYEVLLIDNNSPPSTKQVVRAFEGRLPLRYLREAQQGLSHARNRALTEFRGQALFFLDDDVQVDRGWLGAYHDALGKEPEASYFGGRIVPAYEGGRPRWLKDERAPLISGLVGLYDLGDETRAYRSGEMHPFGGNFGIRRLVYQRIGAFREDLGVRGRVPGRGEEAEFLNRARSAGLMGAYVGAAKCAHWIPPTKLSWRYLFEYGVQKGIAEVRTGQQAAGSGSVLREATFAIRGAMQVLRRRGDWARICVINMGIQRGLRMGAAL